VGLDSINLGSSSIGVAAIGVALAADAMLNPMIPPPLNMRPSPAIFPNPNRMPVSRSPKKISRSQSKAALSIVEPLSRSKEKCA
jgi:hypothetical protein